MKIVNLMSVLLLLIVILLCLGIPAFQEYQVRRACNSIDIGVEYGAVQTLVSEASYVKMEVIRYENAKMKIYIMDDVNGLFNINNLCVVYLRHNKVESLEVMSLKKTLEKLNIERARNN